MWILPSSNAKTFIENIVVNLDSFYSFFCSFLCFFHTHQKHFSYKIRSTLVWVWHFRNFYCPVNQQRCYLWHISDGNNLRGEGLYPEISDHDWLAPWLWVCDTAEYYDSKGSWYADIAYFIESRKQMENSLSQSKYRNWYHNLVTLFF